MQANSGASRVLLLSVFVIFILAATAPGQQVVDKSAPTTSTSTTSAPSPEGSKYVGAETCKTCHEAIYNGWKPQVGADYGEIHRRRRCQLNPNVKVQP